MSSVGYRLSSLKDNLLASYKPKITMGGWEAAHNIISSG